VTDENTTPNNPVPDASASENQAPQAQPARRWQILNSMDRRVLGVLAEKAKTTPDVYPMSLNGICTGANQKSNRDPVMQLEPEQVEESLDRLREMGAVAIIEGYGRVAKYRHYLYEWLGVDKVELSVMTELLLRGDQTLGELRTRASRMDPIPDLNALKTILDSLKAKELIMFLTPEGRGQVVTHTLYKPREVEALKQKYAGATAHASAYREEDEGVTATPRTSASSTTHGAAPTVSLSLNTEQIAALQRELETMRNENSQLRSDVEKISTELNNLAEEFKKFKQDLGG
jgi:uncharacterized protein